MKKIIFIISVILLYSTIVSAFNANTIIFKNANKSYEEAKVLIDEGDLKGGVVFLRLSRDGLENVGDEIDNGELLIKVDADFNSITAVLVDDTLKLCGGSDYSKFLYEFQFLVEKELLTFAQKERFNECLMNTIRTQLGDKDKQKNAVALKACKMYNDLFRGSAESKEIGGYLNDYFYYQAYKFYESGNESFFNSLYRDFCYALNVDANEGKAQEMKQGILNYFQKKEDKDNENLSKNEQKEREDREYKIQMSEIDAKKSLYKNVKSANFYNLLLDYR
jgi:hypothetical protein